MKRRSNTTTFILAAALIGCLGIVGGAVKNKPAEPPKAGEHAEGDGHDHEKEAPVKASTVPDNAGKAPEKKSAEQEKADLKMKMQQKKLESQMREKYYKQEQTKKATPPSEDPSTMAIESTYYTRPNSEDGAEGRDKLIQRMDKIKQEKAKAALKSSPSLPQSKSQKKEIMPPGT